MTSVPAGRTLALTLLAVSTLTAPVLAQDPCPSASGADAEAGWAAYIADDMEGARRYFETALARCDNDQYSRTGLGYVDLRDGNEAAAELNWATVIMAEPNNVDALVGLGLARWRAGDIDAVRESFMLVLELAPEHPTAVEYLDRIAGDGAGPAAADDPADDAWTSGNTALAFRLYNERLAADPEDRTAMLRVALMRAWQEQYEPAVELLDRLIEIQPGHLDARLARARVRAWGGDAQGAQQEVLEVLAVQPDNAEALEALALFQAWAGQYEEALSSYDDLLSINPGSSGAQRQQAQALAWAAQFEASRAAYDALIERDPEDIEARLGLARTLSFSQDFAGAIEQYDEVLSRAPSELRALTGKSKTLGWAGDLLESERVAREAVDIDRTSAEAWGGLGQVLRWQGRNAAAQEALEAASELAPTNAEVRDQLRSVDLTFAPVARPTVVYESDSDDNRMVTTSISSSWHPMPRLDLRAQGYYKDLDQGALLRTAMGATVSGRYQLTPGWTMSAGLGASGSNGTDDPSAFEYQASVRTPDRRRVGATIGFAASALNETAWLAELGTRSSEFYVAGRWAPALGWRVDGTVGAGKYQGREDNGRRSASLSASKRIGRFFSLGGSLRGFSFEQDLDDGYFDPDFYGIAEVTSYWLYRPDPWTLLVELAPGVQQIRQGGPRSSSVRSNVRAAYRIGVGREVSLSFRYSSAGLVNFATTAANYSYTSFTLGSNWVF